MDFLALAEWRTVRLHETERDYEVEAIPLSQPHGCIHCGFPCVWLQRHGTIKQSVKDAPMRGKRVIIRFKRQRYLCRLCNRTSLQPLSHIDEKRFGTTRWVEFIEKESFKKPFLAVADETGGSEKTIRNIFNDKMETLSNTVAFDTPRILGIDGVYVRRKERCILTDIENHWVIELLPTIKEFSVYRALASLAEKERVEVITMDMSASLRRAAREALPDAVIVVDRFHIQRMANDAVNTVRKRLRKELQRNGIKATLCRGELLKQHINQLDAFDENDLNAWLERIPDLKAAYNTKESFFSVWHSSSSDTARERYETWLAQMPESVAYAFEPLLRAMKNWQKEVFAYFDHRFTNAFTESANSKVKAIQRMGRRYSFDVLRAKVLYVDCFSHKHPPTKINIKLNIEASQGSQNIQSSCASNNNNQARPEFEIQGQIYHSSRQPEGHHSTRPNDNQGRLWD